MSNDYASGRRPLVQCLYTPSSHLKLDFPCKKIAAMPIVQLLIDTKTDSLFSLYSWWEFPLHVNCFRVVSTIALVIRTKVVLPKSHCMNYYCSRHYLQALYRVSYPCIGPYCIHISIHGDAGKPLLSFCPFLKTALYSAAERATLAKKKD